MDELPALGSNVSGSVKKKVNERLATLGRVVPYRSDSLKVATMVAEVTGWEMPGAEATHQFFVRFLRDFGQVKQRHDEASSRTPNPWMRPAYSYAGDSREAREMRRNLERVADLRAMPSVKDGQLRE